MSKTRIKKIIFVKPETAIKYFCESENDNEVLLSVVYLLDIKKNPYKVTASPVHNTPFRYSIPLLQIYQAAKTTGKIDLSPNNALKINSVQITSCHDKPPELPKNLYKLGLNEIYVWFLLHTNKI